MMQSKLKLMAAMVGAFAVAFAQPGPSPEQGANLAHEKGKEGVAAGVSLLKQASELVSYARENESVVAMLAAAQILNTVHVQEGADRVSGKKTGLQQPGEAIKEEKKRSTEAPTLDARKLLAEARPWAAGNAHLTALLDAELNKKKPAGGTLGSTQGVIMHRDSVKARSYDDFVIRFYAGELARIAVVGDGDTDIDLVVFDENGHEIARDDDRTSNCVVSFTPKWTGPFRIRIVNNGWVYSEYLLMTN